MLLGGVMTISVFDTTAFMVPLKFSAAKLVLIRYVHNSEDCFGSRMCLLYYL